jgi:hypothetical protein
MTATISSLILKRAAASRTSGEWRQDDSDLVADGIVVDQTPRVHHPARSGRQSRGRTAPPSRAEPYAARPR